MATKEIAAAEAGEPETTVPGGDAGMAALAESLVAAARTQGVQLTGPGGLLTGLTRQVLETALQPELGEHLGHERGDRAGHGRGNIAQRVDAAQDGAVPSASARCSSRCRGTVIPASSRRDRRARGKRRLTGVR